MDGVWPRGIKKEDLEHDEWYKDIAPSADLRKWFDHDAEKWEEFKKKYNKELKNQNELVDKIKEDADGHNVTLLYAAKDTEHNQAVVIKEYIDEK